MPNLKTILPIIENLVGKKSSLKSDYLNIELFIKGKSIGYSQFNEILLLLGFNRVNKNFFQYLAEGNWNYKPETSIKNIEQLNEGIERITKLALLYYGNIKHAFQIYSTNPEILEQDIYKYSENSIDDFKSRHNPFIDFEEIPPDKTYYLGYIIGNEIETKLKINPNDENALNEKKIQEEFIEIGKKNQIAYLASDHLDIYVATSMRLKHEFYSISHVIKNIFNSEQLKELNLRWFDPTQAYCKNRIDKGLSEALMLKRADCTLYLAQESETLGKDSELASTLAQGKPVIAYVPEGDKQFVDDLLVKLKEFNPEKSEQEIILEQLQIYAPSAAWDKKQQKIRDWISDKNIDLLEMKDQLYTFVSNYYTKRAQTLKDNHPLGIQVNLNSGVANGVLVARTIDECITLIKNVLLNKMDFKIVREDPKNPRASVYLVEKTTESIFRIQTDDQLLSNTFWNFYNS